MIDTIILVLPRDKATMLDLTGRGVPTLGPTSANKDLREVRQERIEQRRREWHVLSTSHRFQACNGKARVAVEFENRVLRLPNFLYQNNLDELRDNDFERVLETLDDHLRQMGVAFPLDVLRNASVSSVHYSKNIELEDGYTSQYVISKLGKINMNKRFDLTRARFMNDGQSLYLYTVAHSFVLYDK